MHLIRAVIQPTKLSTVRDALAELGVQNLTISDATGYGRQRGQRPSFRGNEYKVDLLRKIILEMVVSDQDIESVLETLGKVAKTGTEGQIGDGKIFLMPIADSIDF
ncbi:MULTISPECIES: P-II family nitrogen regulator [Crateriforma]|uniref:Nitrogen regulatory protein P-II n=1 Tax=Crateriforma conspicua TaxID=2527996 RepID=A0A5C6FXX8_9PLAN|nr:MULTISPECIES: P-II family nitrogen regulator [Crateriforma]QDV63415.1 Nitrogen regulatory protein P-II [Crateriforma conspicua]TWT67812.1 Nitrogen regulatory protein P-II [Crateriforma conspicua]TWU67246.1 Nitrogen regulatory protein P-II [Crateriforma conspicua]